MMVYVLLVLVGILVSFNESDDGEFDSDADEFDNDNCLESFVTLLGVASCG